jgi:hypothetical protein
MTLNDFCSARVLTAAKDTIRNQTTRSAKSSKSILRALKGGKAGKDAEELSALEAKISAALDQFKVRVPSISRLSTSTHVTLRLNPTFGWS